MLQCGIDIGTTNVKVALVNDDGRPAWTRAVPTPRSKDAFGEGTDALGLVHLLESMIIEGWHEVGQGCPLRAIATTGVGEDGIGVSDNLVPTDLALPWYDQRAAAQAQSLNVYREEAKRAGIIIDFSRTAAKWLWLNQHRPETLRGATKWIALTDYPSVIWSGNPFMSETLAVRTACYDIYKRGWIEALLLASGAPVLPPVVSAGTSVGNVVRGALRESGAADASTVVVAGGHDHPIAASAIRRVDRSARVDSMGTANLVYAEASVPLHPKTDPFLAFSVPVGGGEGLACLGVFEFAAALAPLRQPTDFVRPVLSLDRIPGGPGSGIPLPRPDEMATAGVRRALEACAMYTRRMFESAFNAGAADGPLYATGGWARSTALLELRASVFGEPITAVEEPELTAVGAALIAAEGAGLMVSYKLENRLRTIQPVGEWTVAYENLYGSYRARLDASLVKATINGKLGSSQAGATG